MFDTRLEEQRLTERRIQNPVEHLRWSFLNIFAKIFLNAPLGSEQESVTS